MEVITNSSERLRGLKRKSKLIGEVAIGAAMKQIGAQSTITMSVGVGLIQGLKYNGSLKRGVKAGLATMGAVTAVNVVVNIARNWDVIKDA